MLYTTILLACLFTGEGCLPPDVALLQWVGQSTAQIEAALGEKSLVSTTVGGTENLQQICLYANAGLTVLYDSKGIAIKVIRATK